MRKEIKIIIFAIITMALNIVAPILVIKTVKSYNAKSYIYGTPDNTVVISEFVKQNDYLYQENLSNLTFVAEDEFFVASYNFEHKDFDLNKTYAIFVNDYICTPISKTGKTVAGTHVIKFKDINKNVLSTTNMETTFEFYNNYSSVLIKLSTNDIQYFNGFKKNPGFILTLTEIDPKILEIVKESTSASEEEQEFFTVKFEVDNSFLSSYRVAKGNKLTSLPTIPQKSGYYFDGWTLNDEVVNPLEIEITANLSFGAKFVEIQQINPTLTMANYVEGQTPSIPVVTGNDGNGEITFYYNTTKSNKNGIEFTTNTVLTEGTYYLYAQIGETKTHYAGITEPVLFKVLKNTSNMDLVTVNFSQPTMLFLANTSRDSVVDYTELESGFSFYKEKNSTPVIYVVLDERAQDSNGNYCNDIEVIGASYTTAFAKGAGFYEITIESNNVNITATYIDSENLPVTFHFRGYDGVESINTDLTQLDNYTVIKEPDMKNYEYQFIFSFSRPKDTSITFEVTYKNGCRPSPIENCYAKKKENTDNVYIITIYANIFISQTHTNFSTKSQN